LKSSIGTHSISGEKSRGSRIKLGFVYEKQCCGSGMSIPDPDFYPSRIPYLGSRIQDPGSRIQDPGSRIQDPKTATEERSEKHCCHTFLCSHKFHKIENYFSFEVLKKKIWANFQRIIELFTQRIVTKLSKIWVWVPGSGKNQFRIQYPEVKKAPDPRSRGQKATGSRIRIRNTDEK
jgi:hypothetical protein